MHRKPKSHRHQMAAMSRWHRAERDRAEGIHDRAPYTDCRLPIVLDLTSYGGQRLRIEPRLGYVAARAIDDATGRIVDCAALKELLHGIADRLPRMMSPRRLGA